MRPGIAFILAISVGLVTRSSADVKIATTQNLRPGTYRTPSYVTRFDGEGSWATSTDGKSPPGAKGHYTVDDGIVTFTTTPLACPQERVRYRLAGTQDGFRLHFLEDTCGRISQLDDVAFVRAN